MVRRIVITLIATTLFASPVLAEDNAGGNETTLAPVAMVADASAAQMTPPVIGPLGPSVARPSVLPVLYGGSVALHALDVYSTLRAIRAGGVETNPAMQGVVGNTGVFIGVKAAVSAASIMAAERVWKNHHPVRAIVLMAASNSLLAVVVARNASVYNALEQRR